MKRYRLRWTPELAVYTLEAPDGRRKIVTLETITPLVAQNDTIRELARLAYSAPGAWADLTVTERAEG